MTFANCSMVSPYAEQAHRMRSMQVGEGASAHLDIFAALNSVLMPLALALLGPGAYSIDARLFGRQEIVIPRASGTSGT